MSECRSNIVLNFFMIGFEFRLCLTVMGEHRKRWAAALQDGPTSTTIGEHRKKHGRHSREENLSKSGRIRPISTISSPGGLSEKVHGKSPVWFPASKPHSRTPGAHPSKPTKSHLIGKATTISEHRCHLAWPEPPPSSAT